jgi:hypothetical protein
VCDAVRGHRWKNNGIARGADKIAQCGGNRLLIDNENWHLSIKN